MLVTSATPQTEAGGLFEPRSSRPAWATEQDENRQNKIQRAEEKEVVTMLNRAGKEPPDCYSITAHFELTEDNACNYVLTKPLLG